MSRLLQKARRLVEPRNGWEAARFVSLYTALALVFSVAITYIVARVFGGPMAPMLYAAFIIPFLIAPWMTWISASAMLRMHAMSLELERLARTDPLSGALNRRGLTEFAEKAFAENRARGTFSVIVLDIDHFKSINDNYGHAAGDSVIARVVETMRRIVGVENAAVGRLGGDELGALIAGASLETAMARAEYLRETIESMIFTHGERHIMVTASIGVSAADPADASPEEVISRADESLYRAKAAGRNRVRAAA
jgi:diguanylate cyclase (GGDEF)-like protein